ncbi:protein NDR1-like [Salvia splendens]|uniref:protein NDR1-like n=1 Tax=Salvia splendens TaxID=180675 RepID=UPI001C266CD6|nr:protein NDR1-like [Salvia splendens]
MAGGSELCLWLTGGGFVTILAAVSFLVQQTVHLPGPRCYLEQLYVPALDVSAAPPPQRATNSTTTNPFLFFVLGLENNLQIRSISYGDVALTFFYGRKAVANYTVPAFYQGMMATAHRRDVVETRGLPWGDAVGAVSAGGTVGFRVELAAQPRFKVLFWYSKEKKVRILADVAVDGTGFNVGGDDVRMHLFVFVYVEKIPLFADLLLYEKLGEVLKGF